MKNIFILFLSILSASSSFAAAGDLVLPGEKWIAKFDKYVCAAYGQAVARPQSLEQFKVTFEQITTDSTLDNALLKASFEENGKPCRYNAILFAENTAQTSQLLQSIAFSPNGGPTTYRDCIAGKAVLDNALLNNKYLYYGHPHNLALMMPGVGTEAVCGEGSFAVGANFVVKGKIKPTP